MDHDTGPWVCPSPSLGFPFRLCSHTPTLSFLVLYPKAQQAGHLFGHLFPSTSWRASKSVFALSRCYPLLSASLERHFCGIRRDAQTLAEALELVRREHIFLQAGLLLVFCRDFVFLRRSKLASLHIRFRHRRCPTCRLAKGATGAGNGRRIGESASRRGAGGSRRSEIWGIYRCMVVSTCGGLCSEDSLFSGKFSHFWGIPLIHEVRDDLDEVGDHILFALASWQAQCHERLPISLVECWKWEQHLCKALF